MAPKSIIKEKKKEDSKGKSAGGLVPQSIEMSVLWGGSKLMWRTNETLMIRVYTDGLDYLQVMIGNSDTDEVYEPIMLDKNKIIIDESAIKKKVRSSQEQNWKLETEELLKQFRIEFYGNFVQSRLNFTQRNEETGWRNVVMQKSGGDDDTFNDIFLTEIPEHVIPPKAIEKPKRRTFEDFINANNALKSVKRDLNRQTMLASKSQKAMQVSIDMIDALKYAPRNATGLRKLKLFALRGVFQKDVARYKKRLASSPIYAEMLEFQESVRIREEVIARKGSAVPSLPPILSPRQSALVSPRA